MLQPGRYDLNCASGSNALLGKLSKFVSITFSTSANNRVDARLRAGGLTLVLLLPLLPGCTPQRKDSSLPPPTVAQVLERHTPRLMSVAGVVGTAEGRCAGQPCILVLVERLTPALRQAIPSELEGIPVEIRETGRIDARPSP